MWMIFKEINYPHFCDIFAALDYVKGAYFGWVVCIMVLERLCIVNYLFSEQQIHLVVS